jgi:hypothetical protein
MKADIIGILLLPVVKVMVAQILLLQQVAPMAAVVAVVA